MITAATTYPNDLSIFGWILEEPGTSVCTTGRAAFAPLFRPIRAPAVGSIVLIAVDSLAMAWFIQSKS
jgi:hypothetical protein